MNIQNGGVSMSNKFGLTKTEMEIMDMFWQENRSFTFKEILDYFNEIREKSWKKQTLITFLSKLIGKGLLNYKKQGKRHYYPVISKEEQIQKWTQELLNKAFGGSFINFLKALKGDGKLDKAMVKDIKDFMK